MLAILTFVGELLRNLKYVSSQPGIVIKQEPNKDLNANVLLPAIPGADSC